MSTSTLVIKSVPKEIHQFLKESARAHRRSLTQEVITLLEQIVFTQKQKKEVAPSDEASPVPANLCTFGGRRKFVPGYLEAAKALGRGTDSSIIISEDRDAR